MLISVKFHYNWIKSLKKPFMITMATVDIFKITNPKCTSTHPKDHSCEISLQSDQKYFFPEENNSPKNSIVNTNYLCSSKYTLWNISNLYAQLDT